MMTLFHSGVKSTASVCFTGAPELQQLNRPQPKFDVINVTCDCVFSVTGQNVCREKKRKSPLCELLLASSEWKRPLWKSTSRVKRRPEHCAGWFMLRHLNTMESLLMLLATPVLFLLWQVKIWKKRKGSLVLTFWFLCVWDLIWPSPVARMKCCQLVFLQRLRTIFTFKQKVSSLLCYMPLNGGVTGKKAAMPVTAVRDLMFQHL